MSLQTSFIVMVLMVPASARQHPTPQNELGADDCCCLRRRGYPTPPIGELYFLPNGIKVFVSMSIDVVLGLCGSSVDFGVNSIYQVDPGIHISDSDASQFKRRIATGLVRNGPRSHVEEPKDVALQGIALPP